MNLSDDDQNTKEAPAHVYGRSRLYCKQKNRTTRSHCTTVSWPIEFLIWIDEIRKDIPRSTFLLRILENSLKTVEMLQPGSKVAAHDRVVARNAAPAAPIATSVESILETQHDKQ